MRGISIKHKVITPAAGLFIALLGVSSAIASPETEYPITSEPVIELWETALSAAGYVLALIELKPVPVATIAGVCLFLFYWAKRYSEKSRKRLMFIVGYEFPKAISETLKQRYPHLTNEQIKNIIHALRAYFSLALLHGEHIAMPSRAVDFTWREFVLLDAEYATFCTNAFGKLLRHKAFATMGSPKSDQKDLINTWVHSCRTEKINPLNPDRLPLLFAVDADFPGGFKYSLDDGIFPQPADGIPPLELLHEIQRRMAETQIVEQRQSTIALLAPKIRRHLLDENYCRNRGRIALAPLCKIVLANEDLATAVFGDIDSAQARSRRIDAFPPPVFWISWARAMQNKNWDGRR